VRLARLMELLTHNAGISEHLRVPAVSRLQKLHNVGLVFKKLNSVKTANGEGSRHSFFVIFSNLPPTPNRILPNLLFLVNCLLIFYSIVSDLVISNFHLLVSHSA
jgi:hypothetical protein